MLGILAGTACCPRRTEELIWGTGAALLIHLARLLPSGSPYPSPVYAFNPPPVICRKRRIEVSSLGVSVRAHDQPRTSAWEGRCVSATYFASRAPWSSPSPRTPR